MHVRRILAQRGPNLWSRTPVLEVAFEPIDGGYVDRLANAGQYVHRWLAEQKSTCATLSTDNGPAELLRSVAIELQKLAGAKVPDLDDGRPALYEASDNRVAVPYDEELVGREAVLIAAAMISAALEDRSFSVETELSRLRDLADQRCLGPSTRAIVEAALKRGIPIQRLNRGSFVQLGYGAKQRRIRTAETDQTSAVAESICQDKDLTKRLLSAVGVPVPDGRPVTDREDAWVAAEEIEVPVVVKPIDGNHGRGVFTGLTTKQQVQRAYDIAVEEGSGVLVEQFAPGREHRLLVVAGQLVAATGGEPAYITGDGESTVEQLVEAQLNSDPRRGEDYDTPLSKIDYDTATRMLLEQQGFPMGSTPPRGQSVLVQRNGNLAYDVTDRVHPSVAARAVDAARVVGLDIAGVDMVVEDIGQPLEPQRGMIVEVNAGPGLQMHLSPMVGKPRPVGEAIVDSLFPPDDQGRIPVVAICGRQAARIANLLYKILLPAFRHVGVSAGGKVQVDGRQLPAIENQAALLMNPMIDAAVFGLTPQEIRESGLPFDRCQLAVFTSSDGTAASHEDPLYRLLAESLAHDGKVIVDAGISGRAMLTPTVNQVLLSEGPSLEVDQHVRQRGAACLVVEDTIYLVADGERHAVFATASLGENEAALGDYLAAIATAWSLGLSARQIQSAVAPTAS